MRTPDGKAHPTQAPRWLTDDEQRAWRAYVDMSSRLTTELNRQLQAEAGLSLSDYEVLVLLSEAPEGRLRPYELGQGLSWEQSRLSHQLTRMQRRGLVAREACPEDRRGAFVTLTGEGHQAIEQVAPGHVEAVRRLVFDGLSPEQVGQVEAFATRVLERMEGTEPGDGARAS